MRTMVYPKIIKQCAFVHMGPENTIMKCHNLRIFNAYHSLRTLLNNVMSMVVW